MALSQTHLQELMAAIGERTPPHIPPTPPAALPVRPAAQPMALNSFGNSQASSVSNAATPLSAAIDANYNALVSLLGGSAPAHPLAPSASAGGNTQVLPVPPPSRRPRVAPLLPLPLLHNRRPDNTPVKAPQPGAPSTSAVGGRPAAKLSARSLKNQPSGTGEPSRQSGQGQTRQQRITQEQIIVGHYCRHAIKTLNRVMQAHPDRKAAEERLRAHIKTTWSTWVRDRITRQRMIESVAAFVRGSCHATRNIDVIKEFKIWYEREFALQKSREQSSTAPHEQVTQQVLNQQNSFQSSSRAGKAKRPRDSSSSSRLGRGINTPREPPPKRPWRAPPPKFLSGSERFRARAQQTLSNALSNSAKKESSVLASAPSGTNDSGSIRNCMLCCTDTNIPHQGVTSSCKHTRNVCQNCVQQYIHSLVHGRGQAEDIRCVELDCRALLSQADVQRVATNDDYTRYVNLQTRRALERLPDFRWCTRPGCGSGQLHDASAGMQIMSCHECGWKTCYEHRVPWHSGMTCDEYDQDSGSKEDSALMKDLGKKGIKRCPKCGHGVQKNGGCDHMKCNKSAGGCGADFCWLCLADYAGPQGIRKIGNKAHRRSCRYYR